MNTSKWPIRMRSTSLKLSDNFQKSLSPYGGSVSLKIVQLEEKLKFFANFVSNWTANAQKNLKNSLKCKKWTFQEIHDLWLVFKSTFTFAGEFLAPKSGLIWPKSDFFERFSGVYPNPHINPTNWHQCIKKGFWKMYYQFSVSVLDLHGIFRAPKRIDWGLFKTFPCFSV